LALAVSASASAQEEVPPLPEPDSGQVLAAPLVSPDSLPRPERASPGGAFLRSLLLPGWGQTAVGAYNRGAFYFVVDGISGWMILKSSKTHSSALRIADALQATKEAELIASGVTDPLQIEAALEDDEEMTEVRGLAETRAQQREDWIAFGLFMLLFGGADAFVSAHLADFPDPLETSIRSTPAGGLEVEMSVMLPFH
jgi:hypothetical protein